MAVMDNPEVPPAIHVRVEQDAERNYSARPIGEVSVTISAGLADDFLNRPAGLVSSGPGAEDDSPDVVADEDSIASAGLVDEFVNRPAELVIQARDDA
ncbi:hypothetical protein [Nocardia brasiliensis]|uniref:hypothetical protein n=1 Tax=Nocardia brasiliensis TaxID=37326 RepID=UPI0034054FBE